MLPELPCDIEGRYSVVAELGRGSHAIVYQAYDRELERDVAIKVLREELIDSSVSERFRREIRLTSKLDHPHIAHVYGTGEWRGAPYFVIALARGPSLAERLAHEHQLPVDEALAITRQVAAALGHAHMAAIIHRDVKPGNILLTPDGALLTDFGVARAIEHSASTKATSTGTAVGTLQYMSPEQLCAEKGVDGRSDQYELALVLYEMLAGVQPHVAANIEGLRALRLVGQQVPVRTHRPSVPVAVENAIERALCPTPADRFRSMGEFVVALDGGDSGSGALRVSAARRTLVPATISAGATQRIGARRWFMPGIAVLGVAAAGVLAAPQIRRVSSATPVAADHDAAAAMFTLWSVGDTMRSAPITRALSDELSAWPEVQATVSSATKVRDGTTALAVRATALDDGTQVTAQVRVGAAVRRVMIQVPAGGAARGDSLRLLAGRLLMARLVAPDSAEALTFVRHRPTAAVRKFGEAWASLLAGDLAEAEVEFAESGRSGALPQAVLWQAIVGSWRQPRAPASWLAPARAAISESKSLMPRDSLIADGLLRRARDPFGDACEPFVQATRIDGGSFATWFGLAQCRSGDETVVADPNSPTGWRFRTSHWSTLRVYEEAIRRVPSTPLVALFGELPAVALALNGMKRTGRMNSAGQSTFVGLPSLSGDSVVVVPLPERAVLSGQRNTLPTSYQSAVRRGRARLLELSHLLVDRAPKSFVAQFALARAFEYAGVLTSHAGQPSATTILDGLRRVARTRAESLVVGVAQVRVQLRLGDFRDAASLGLALVNLDAVESPDESAQRALIAVLLGRLGEAELLLTRANLATHAQPRGLPVRVAESYAHYAVYAAARSCDDSQAARAVLLSEVQAHYAPDEVAGIYARWVEPVDWIQLHCSQISIPRKEGDDDPMLRAFALLRQGSLSEARDLARKTSRDRYGVAASAIAWDTRFAEAYLLTQVGDTAAAKSQINAALNDLAGTMDLVLFDVSQVAGFRRSIILCSQLWQGQGNTPLTQRCADASAALRM